MKNIQQRHALLALVLRNTHDGRRTTTYLSIITCRGVARRAKTDDPALGRFVQADSIVQSPYNPQSLNRYSYCFNNPVSRIDPSGNSSDFIGNIIGSFFEGLNSLINGGSFSEGFSGSFKANGVSVGVTSSFGSGAGPGSGRSYNPNFSQGSVNISNMGYTRTLSVSMEVQNLYGIATMGSFDAEATEMYEGSGLQEDFLGLDWVFDGVDLTRLYSDNDLSAGEKVAYTPVVALPFLTAGAVKSVGKRIVIGETMERVIKKADRMGADVYNPRKKISEIGIKKAL